MVYTMKFTKIVQCPKDGFQTSYGSKAFSDQLALHQGLNFKRVTARHSIFLSALTLELLLCGERLQSKVADREPACFCGSAQCFQIFF